MSVEDCAYVCLRKQPTSPPTCGFQKLRDLTFLYSLSSMDTYSLSAVFARFWASVHRGFGDADLWVSSGILRSDQGCEQQGRAGNAHLGFLILIDFVQTLHLHAYQSLTLECTLSCIQHDLPVHLVIWFLGCLSSAQRIQASHLTNQGLVGVIYASGVPICTSTGI